ncbi:MULTISPECIES: ferritin [unclassified Meiothermus]|uniref:ferritin n=1 Tax=unclassified Meiothermus TaxID=370471 RepID=UPI000D7BC23C|nr:MULTISPECIES: ferritin [unclassified Meiothermus]PZA06350.1 ferritin [Meiothermus sp. Pnk-1]RYM35223.1 ferritin [Meiothermus sp. PNK-Is4]
MISKRLQERLNQQIGHELTASQQYLGMAAYCGGLNLSGWQAFFERQSEEERTHALRIFRFLLEVGAPVRLPALPEVKTEYASLLEANQAALAYEQKVTRDFQAMAQAALEENDHTTYAFLQWYLQEQIEEESQFSRLVSLLESGLNPFLAESLLPKGEEE